MTLHADAEHEDMNSALNSLFHNDCKMKHKKSFFRDEFYPLKILIFLSSYLGRYGEKKIMPEAVLSPSFT